ncbi:(E)-4-hydroxy-3-methylbut-2-enyl-diphosphate synthase [Porphyromonas levii]|uniref:(E)-4-hydroxy-3-methylbut-2-enyl-diphosphate synthase n=1 Tax=Porphyromonas levii TaxID=28114 RepID=UPI0003637C39|nr:(E)-4-hydroxy-3-methylbut-2-enyl-diphosphate synthase [Porphyromonas levii]
MRYTRRQTTPARVGQIEIGGDAPIVIQSMTNVDTNDIEASVAQIQRLDQAGAQLVRLTAQGPREAKALGETHRRIREAGCQLPLSADIHFNPKAAYEAALHVEKVRINPGNFYDPARRFKQIEYTDTEYAEEVKGLQESFEDFLEHCKQHHTAIRIGVNHGSLSDRIMSRYGDTPEGMVESCMEFLDVCHRTHFHDVVLSIKSSNPLVMTHTVRLLAARMETAGMHYPLHLGVTEAGNGEDGRIKSAVGIGTLLSEGIGDTIRVSLSEEPEAEIPVAKVLLQALDELAHSETLDFDTQGTPFRSEERPLVLMDADDAFGRLLPEERPDIQVTGQTKLRTILDTEALLQPRQQLEEGELLVVQLSYTYAPTLMLAALDQAMEQPYILRIDCGKRALEELPTWLGFQLGGALMRGQLQGLYLRSDIDAPLTINSIAFGLLQATRRRISRTDYISCPSCGRTLFDLQSTVARIKGATSHLRGLKIGVMGCIVNGPGEMADADYGYVGSAPGKVDLYKQKERLKRNIPQEEAVTELINLIKEHGDWKEPETL